MPLPTVATGPYRFFTKAQLDTEQARYIAAVQTAGSALAGSTQNGQSLTFGPRRDWSLKEWGEHLAGAYAQVAPGLYADPVPARTAARFY